MAETVGPHKGLPSNEPLQLVHASLLVVVDPPDPVEVAEGPHVLWELLGIRELEVINHGDDVAVVLKGCDNLPVELALVGQVSDALVQGVWGEDDDKVLGLPHIVEDILIRRH